ncbi:glycosyl hydrolase 53 family protein [Streptomyces sp. NPDC102462]|uniref:glycosyl hydrolase 53 family protein n=1 Tax=Streptomyces sp. NPDC102462 TaxID=3366178 RepID=UPI00381D33E5
MDVSRYTSPDQYFGLLHAGSEAAKAASPSSRIVMHLTSPDRTDYADWIAGAKARGVPYDLIGLSLYPYWTGLSIASMTNFATWASTTSGKRAMICEFGAAWNDKPYGADETTQIGENGLDIDGPENYGASTAGQYRYLREYMRSMANTGEVDAMSYWDPISIDGGNGPDPYGWVVGGDKSDENTSLFDYSFPHKPVQGLDAFTTYWPSRGGRLRACAEADDCRVREGVQLGGRTAHASRPAQRSPGPTAGALSPVLRARRAHSPRDARQVQSHLASGRHGTERPCPTTTPLTSDDGSAVARRTARSPCRPGCDPRLVRGLPPSPAGPVRSCARAALRIAAGRLSRLFPPGPSASTSAAAVRWARRR